MIGETWSGKEFQVERLYPLAVYNEKKSNNSLRCYSAVHDCGFQGLSLLVAGLLIPVIVAFILGVGGFSLFIEGFFLAAFLGGVLIVVLRLVLEIFNLGRSMCCQVTFSDVNSASDVVNLGQTTGWVNNLPSVGDDVVASWKTVQWLHCCTSGNRSVAKVASILFLVACLLFLTGLSIAILSGESSIWLIGLLAVVHLFVTVLIWQSANFWSRNYDTTDVVGVFFKEWKERFCLGGGYIVASLLSAIALRNYPGACALQSLLLICFTGTYIFEFLVAREYIQRDPWKLVLKGAISVCVCVIYFCFLIAFYATSSHYPWQIVIPILISLACVLVMWILVFEVFRDYPYGRFVRLYVFFSLISFVLVLIFVNSDLTTTIDTSMALVNPGKPTPAATNPLGICFSSWETLSIIDFALFSSLAYESPTIVQGDLDIWFNEGTGRNWTVANGQAGGKTQQFYDFYDPSQNISVVAIRGTTPASDWAQNLDNWNEVAILQALDYLVPTVSIWPPKIGQFLVSIFSVDYFLSSQGGSTYYQDVDAYVARVIGERRTVIMAGHSLGGGLASILGGKYNLRAITLSAPGAELSRAKFGIPQSADLRALLTNVVPDKDIVPRIDLQSGLAQMIPCTLDSLTCHYAKTTVATLLRSCGDPRGRSSTLIEEQGQS